MAFDNKSCLRCEAEFTPRRKASRFCGETCRVGWYKDQKPKPIKPCAYCREPVPKGSRNNCGAPECRAQAEATWLSNTTPCVHQGCSRPSHCKGYCSKHYYTEYQRQHEHRYSYTCTVCGNGYTTHRQARGAYPACGRGCRTYLAMWTAGGNTGRTTRDCAICGTPTQAIGIQPVCSLAACRDAYGSASARAAQVRRRQRIIGNGGMESIDRLAVFTRDNYLCHLCGTRTDPSHYPNPNYPTLDHLIPISRGGQHTYANVRCACFRCNVVKGARGSGEQLALIG